MPAVLAQRNKIWMRYDSIPCLVHTQHLLLSQPGNTRINNNRHLSPTLPTAPLMTDLMAIALHAISGRTITIT